MGCGVWWWRSSQCSWHNFINNCGKEGEETVALWQHMQIYKHPLFQTSSSFWQVVNASQIVNHFFPFKHWQHYFISALNGEQLECNYLHFTACIKRLIQNCRRVIMEHYRVNYLWTEFWMGCSVMDVSLIGYRDLKEESGWCLLFYLYDRWARNAFIYFEEIKLYQVLLGHLLHSHCAGIRTGPLNTKWCEKCSWFIHCCLAHRKKAHSAGMRLSAMIIPNLSICWNAGGGVEWVHWSNPLSPRET